MPERPRHRKLPKRSTRIAKRVAWVVGVLSVVLVTGLVVVIKQLEGNITELDVGDKLGDRPEKVIKGPINVLVMGDDTRKGQGPSIAGTTPGLSDTTILLHLSADRESAYGISLPRDSMVERPECETTNGIDPGGLTQFNAAYAIGGPACTIKTVESLTNIRIDHFVVIKFAGFRKMVDAIGGVEVCLPEEVPYDDLYRIHLPEGTYNASGSQALDYVRVRHGLGDGSDIGRMKRQQTFIASMINKVVSAGTLANPVKLYNFLNEATKSLITDPGFSHLQPLVGLGSSLQGIGLDNIRFMTVPFEAYPPDPNRLQWAPEADRLWRLIRLDRPVPANFDKDAVTAAGNQDREPDDEGSTSPSPDPSASSSPSAEPTMTEEERAANARRYGLCA